MIKIETVTKDPREGFIYALIGLALSGVLGFGFAAIIAIVLSWWHLANVALYTYRRE